MYIYIYIYLQGFINVQRWLGSPPCNTSHGRHPFATVNFHGAGYWISRPSDLRSEELEGFVQVPRCQNPESPPRTSDCFRVNYHKLPHVQAMTNHAWPLWVYHGSPNVTVDWTAWSLGMPRWLPTMLGLAGPKQSLVDGWGSSSSASRCPMSEIFPGKMWHMGMSENGAYPQWNSHWVGIMLSKTSGFFGVHYFQTNPYVTSSKLGYHGMLR